MLRRVAAFCRPLRPVLLPFVEPSGWCAGAVLDVVGCAVCVSAASNNWRIEDVLLVVGDAAPLILRSPLHRRNGWSSGQRRKRHIPPHPAQPRHTDHWAPRTRKRRQQEHRPQRPTERSDPTQHAKGRTGDCPGPRKETTTRRTVTRGGGGVGRTPPLILRSPLHPAEWLVQRSDSRGASERSASTMALVQPPHPRPPPSRFTKPHQCPPPPETPVAWLYVHVNHPHRLEAAAEHRNRAASWSPGMTLCLPLVHETTESGGRAKEVARHDRPQPRMRRPHSQAQKPRAKRCSTVHFGAAQSAFGDGEASHRFGGPEHRPIGPQPALTTRSSGGLQRRDCRAVVTQRGKAALPRKGLGGGGGRSIEPLG